MIILSDKKSLLPTIKENFLILLIILITANASTVSTDNFLLLVLIIAFLSFVYKGYSLDPIIIYVLIVWIIINCFAYLINETPFRWYTFFGFSSKMIYPYLLLKLIGPNFPFKLERIIYILTLISLPFFFLEVSLPGFFNNLSPYLNFFTQEEQQHANGWYIFIFMHSGWSEYRNCGFMWEPGAFAFMILLGMTIRFMKYGRIKIDKYIIIYILALLTTISTMGYLALFIIIMAFAIQKKKLLLLPLLLPLLIPIFIEILKLDFLLPKIATYFDQLDVMYTPDNTTYLKVNRFSYMLLAINQSLTWPFGFGIVQNKDVLKEYSSDVLGVSTLANILIYWGWLGITVFFYAISKFYSKIQFQKNNILLGSSIIALTIAFFSNPLEKSPILFILIFYPFVYRRLKLKMPTIYNRPLANASE